MAFPNQPDVSRSQKTLPDRFPMTDVSRSQKTLPDRFPKESSFFFSPNTGWQQRVKSHTWNLPHNPKLKASDLHNADLGRQTSY
jgi:hypothetical protein